MDILDDESNKGSVWTRYWWPNAALKSTPPQASPAERAAIRSRNNVWLKTYMDLYILRWGVLWAVSLGLALLTTNDAVPGLLFAIALVLTLAAFFGLISMVMIYRRAAKAVRDWDRGGTNQ